MLSAQGYLYSLGVMTHENKKVMRNHASGGCTR